MALILSIETSTTVCSVALNEGVETLASEILFTEQSHSTHLTLLIKEVFHKAGKVMNDLSAVAVSEGPGSYTGLRIGVSTAKGICYTLGIPLIGVSTLQAMAQQAAQTGQGQSADLLIPMLDARRMEVYTATFGLHMNMLNETQPMILDEQSFQETLVTNKVLFFGNGSDKYRPLVNSENAQFLDDLIPQAWAVGELAAEKFVNKNFVDVAYFEPNYLKAYRATTPKKLL